MAQPRNRNRFRDIVLCLALLGTSATALAQATGSLAVDNYPQYGTAPDLAQQEKLRHVARAAVGAASTGTHVSMTIYGHADFDAQGPESCRDVSLRRAQRALDSMRALVAEEAAKLSPPVNVPATRLREAHTT